MLPFSGCGSGAQSRSPTAQARTHHFQDERSESQRRLLRAEDVDTYHVRSTLCSMNVTLSIDDETLARARELARRRGISLNQLIRDYLDQLATDLSPEETLAELADLWAVSNGDSRGRPGRVRNSMMDPHI